MFAKLHSFEATVKRFVFEQHYTVISPDNQTCVLVLAIYTEHLFLIIIDEAFY